MGDRRLALVRVIVKPEGVEMQCSANPVCSSGLMRRSRDGVVLGSTGGQAEKSWQYSPISSHTNAKSHDLTYLKCAIHRTSWRSVVGARSCWRNA